MRGCEPLLPALEPETGRKVWEYNIGVPPGKKGRR